MVEDSRVQGVTIKKAPKEDMAEGQEGQEGLEDLGDQEAQEEEAIIRNVTIMILIQ